MYGYKPIIPYSQRLFWGRNRLKGQLYAKLNILSEKTECYHINLTLNCIRKKSDSKNKTVIKKKKKHTTVLDTQVNFPTLAVSICFAGRQG